MRNKVMCLSEALDTRQVPFLCPAIANGSHCPLFGVTMATPFMEDLAVLIVGTAECCWHSKNQHMATGSRQPFYTYVLDNSEVVFGADQALREALQTIWRECHPKAIALVSSCVPELIGENFEEIAEEADLPIPVLPVRTSHYNSSGYYRGIQHFYSSFLPIMARGEKNDRVALLGARYAGMERSEIYRLLRESGREILIPHRVEEMASLPDCALLVVVDITALDLAESISRRFGTPFVRLDRICRPQSIAQCYRQIDGFLGTDLTDRSQPQYRQVLEKMEQVRKKWAGKRFCFGAPFFLPFENSLFFAQMGLIPAFLLAREFFPEDDRWAEELLDLGFDPGIASFASMGELEEALPEMDISMFFGATHLQGLEKARMLTINPHAMPVHFGYALPLEILDQMLKEQEKEGS